MCVTMRLGHRIKASLLAFFAAYQLERALTQQSLAVVAELYPGQVDVDGDDVTRLLQLHDLTVMLCLVQMVYVLMQIPVDFYYLNEQMTSE